MILIGKCKYKPLDNLECYYSYPLSTKESNLNKCFKKITELWLFYGKQTMLESIHEDLNGRFAEAYARGDVYLLAAGSADDVATAKWLKQIEAAFPGMPILYDDLSMGVSCHTGEGALGIGLSVRPQV